MSQSSNIRKRSNPSLPILLGVLVGLIGLIVLMAAMGTNHTTNLIQDAEKGLLTDEQLAAKEQKAEAQQSQSSAELHAEIEARNKRLKQMEDSVLAAKAAELNAVDSNVESGSTAESEPNAASGGTYRHVVGSGQSLYSIARMYGNSLADLKALNAEIGDKLSQGQEVKVKIQAQHTPVTGEGLAAIARKYKVSAEKLKLANGLSNDNIPAGRSLIIPLGQ